MRRSNSTRTLVGLVALALLAPAPSLAASPPDDSATREPRFAGLGTFGRKLSAASPEAQAYFDQGLCLLYAFNHDEAERSFRVAARLDPDCALAWWGVAVAQGPHINHPLLPDDRAQVAREAIARASSLADRADAVERGLIEAAAARYAEGERPARDQVYAEAMTQLHQAHPGDADVAALCAEALMDLRPWDQWDRDGSPQPGTERVLDVLAEALSINPNHPLALHLTIHAVEASPHPERALPAADRLRALQPGLPHLVHMPSHIDVRLGHWGEAAAANDRAIASDKAYRDTRPEQGFYRLYSLHNYHMLAYAALMRGQSARAIAAVDAMMAAAPIEWARANAPIADGYLAMPLEVRMRFGRWEEILAAPEPEATFPLARALRHATRGVAFAATDRVEAARDELAALRAGRQLVAPEARFGNSPAHGVLDVAERLLDGEILYRAGDQDAAFERLRAAVQAEDALNYDEPPDWIIPVRHALGAALIKSGRPQEAETVYRDDLRKLPRNGWSLFGLARALRLQGQAEQADAIQAQLEQVWHEADVELTSSCFCLAEPQPF